MKEIKRYKKITKIISDVVFLVIIATVVIICIVSLTSSNNNSSKNTPSLFGLKIVEVQSNSMLASGIEKGDSAIIKSTETSKLQVGDVIAFYNYVDQSNPAPNIGTPAQDNSLMFRKSIWFHEIIEIAKDNNGVSWYTTKGTSNNLPDGNKVREDYVVGRYVKIPTFITSSLSFLNTTTGLLVVVALPCLLLFVILFINLMHELNAISYENKLINGSLEMEHPICKKYKLPYDMSLKKKIKLISTLPEEEQKEFSVKVIGEKKAKKHFPDLF